MTTNHIQIYYNDARWSTVGYGPMYQTKRKSFTLALLKITILHLDCHSRRADFLYHGRNKPLAPKKSSILLLLVNDTFLKFLSVENNSTFLYCVNTLFPTHCSIIIRSPKYWMISMTGVHVSFLQPILLIKLIFCCPHFTSLLCTMSW